MHIKRMHYTNMSHIERIIINSVILKIKISPYKKYGFTKVVSTNKLLYFNYRCKSVTHSENNVCMYLCMCILYQFLLRCLFLQLFGL